MKNKIIFIDIDGTLTDDFGQIPESAFQAISAAQKRGHEVFLCTGRARPEYQLVLDDLIVSGVVGAGGSFIQLADKILSERHFSVEEILHLTNYLEKKQLHFYLASNQTILINEELRKKIDGIEALVSKKRKICIKPIDYTSLITEKISKINFFNKKIPFDTLLTDLAQDYTISPSTIQAFGKNSGEIMPPRTSKQIGIECVLQHLNRSKEDTIGIGNGSNDVPRFAGVHTKIAVSSADEELIKLADHVTAAPQDHGIYKAFEWYGLI